MNNSLMQRPMPNADLHLSNCKISLCLLWYCTSAMPVATRGIFPIYFLIYSTAWLPSVIQYLGIGSPAHASTPRHTHTHTPESFGYCIWCYLLISEDENVNLDRWHGRRGGAKSSSCIRSRWYRNLDLWTKFLQLLHARFDPLVSQELFISTQTILVNFWFV